MKGFKNRLIAITLAISQVLMPITYIVSALSDLRAETIVKEVELDNQPPLADFDLLKKQKIDIVFAVGQTNPVNLIELDTRINSYVNSYLNANGGDVLDTNIPTIKTSGQDMQNAFTWNQHLNIDRNIGSIAFQNNGNKE